MSFPVSLSKCAIRPIRHKIAVMMAKIATTFVSGQPDKFKMMMDRRHLKNRFPLVFLKYSTCDDHR